MLLPFIRQDLKIINGSAKEDGSPSWLLYDSLRHKYFVLTKTTLILLKNWVGGEKVDALIKKIEELKLNIKQRDIEPWYEVYPAFEKNPKDAEWNPPSSNKDWENIRFSEGPNFLGFKQKWRKYAMDLWHYLNNK